MVNAKKPELLMPAGSFEVLKTALNFGADAVYIGGDLYGLRAKAHNFDHDEMTQAVRYVHDRGKKIYVTVNITAHNSDMEGVGEYLKELEQIGPDGLIISDPGVFTLAGKYAPSVERHISTQANNVNYLTFNFWHELGATRVVSARELSLAEIKEIRSNIPDDLEIESFIHGAMCISYSGRCLLSNYMTGRDANLGECTHPCRWKYHLVEETRPGEYMPIEENERGSYIFNSRDLCMVDHIPEIVDAGINSLKVEGRMKTALYVATVARAYRNAIDTYFEDPELYSRMLPVFFDEITKCTNRKFTSGFYFGKPTADSMVYENSTYVKEYVYYGTIEEAVHKQDTSVAVLMQKNKFCLGDELEVLAPGPVDNPTVRVLAIEDMEGNAMDSCPHASQMIRVTLSGKVNTGDILRGKG